MLIVNHPLLLFDHLLLLFDQLALPFGEIRIAVDHVRIRRLAGFSGIRRGDRSDLARDSPFPRFFSFCSAKRTNHDVVGVFRFTGSAFPHIVLSFRAVFRNHPSFI